MFIVGGIVCVVGVGLLLMYFSSKKRLEEITAVETSTTAALQEICTGVATEIGAGSFEQQTEVKGIIECEAPLESEIAKQPCVHYRMSVERKWEEDYEEEYTETDPDTGKEIQKTRQGTRQGSDTVSSNSRSVNFMVRDDTGTIEVQPEGAELDTEQVVDRFEPQTASGGTIAFGGFSFSLGEAGGQGGRRRTLGYQFREWILPLRKQVYVLGSASDASGKLQIQKPREQGKFVVSLQTEEELVASAQSGMKWGLYGAIGCFALGILCMLIGMIS